MSELPLYPQTAGQVLDASLHLLDRQVVDNDLKPVSYVSDVELGEWTPGEPLIVTSLVLGSGLLSRVFGGPPPYGRLFRVGWSDVAKVGVTVELGISGAGMDVTWSETWVKDRIISRIPGGRHAAE